MQSKKVGGGRFQGRGLSKWDPKPGSVEFYKANLPEKLNNTAINLRNGLGLPMEDWKDDAGNQQLGAVSRAALVLSWSEKPLSNIKFDLPDKCPSCGTFTNHAAAEKAAKGQKK